MRVWRQFQGIVAPFHLSIPPIDPSQLCYIISDLTVAFCCSTYRQGSEILSGTLGGLREIDCPSSNFFYCKRVMVKMKSIRVHNIIFVVKAHNALMTWNIHDFRFSTVVPIHWNHFPSHRDYHPTLWEHHLSLSWNLHIACATNTNLSLLVECGQVHWPPLA